MSGTQTTEPLETRLRRMRMRSWRRGTKEMDLILGPFADTRLAELSRDELDCYDRMLDENDQDLYRWITGQEAPPEWLAGLLARIARAAGVR